MLSLNSVNDKSFSFLDVLKDGKDGAFDEFDGDLNRWERRDDCAQ